MRSRTIRTGRRGFTAGRSNSRRNTTSRKSKPRRSSKPQCQRPKVKDDYSDLDAKYKVQAEPTITTHSNSPSYTPHVPQLPQGFSVNINPQPTQGQLLSAQTPEHQIPKAWENTDITQLVSVTSAPTSLQLGAAVKLNDKCTADTKYWSFAAIWQRVDSAARGHCTCISTPIPSVTTTST